MKHVSRAYIRMSLGTLYLPSFYVFLLRIQYGQNSNLYLNRLLDMSNAIYNPALGRRGSLRNLTVLRNNANALLCLLRLIFNAFRKEKGPSEFLNSIKKSLENHEFLNTYGILDLRRNAAPLGGAQSVGLKDPSEFLSRVLDEDYLTENFWRCNAVSPDENITIKDVDPDETKPPAEIKKIRPAKHVLENILALIEDGNIGTAYSTSTRDTPTLRIRRDEMAAEMAYLTSTICALVPYADLLGFLWCYASSQYVLDSFMNWSFETLQSHDYRIGEAEISTFVDKVQGSCLCPENENQVVVWLSHASSDVSLPSSGIHDKTSPEGKIPSRFQFSPPQIATWWELWTPNALPPHLRQNASLRGSISPIGKRLKSGTRVAEAILSPEQKNSPLPAIIVPGDEWFSFFSLTFGPPGEPGLSKIRERKSRFGDEIYVTTLATLTRMENPPSYLQSQHFDESYRAQIESLRNPLQRDEKIFERCPLMTLGDSAERNWIDEQKTTDGILPFVKVFFGEEKFTEFNTGFPKFIELLDNVFRDTIFYVPNTEFQAVLNSDSRGPRIPFSSVTQKLFPPFLFTERHIRAWLSIFILTAMVKISRLEQVCAEVFPLDQSEESEFMLKEVSLPLNILIIIREIQTTAKKFVEQFFKFMRDEKARNPLIHPLSIDALNGLLRMVKPILKFPATVPVVRITGAPSGEVVAPAFIPPPGPIIHKSFCSDTCTGMRREALPPPPPSALGRGVPMPPQYLMQAQKCLCPCHIWPRK